MQFFKSTIWSLLVALTIVIVGYSGYSIYADTIIEYTDQFADTDDSFNTIKSNYHEAMNDYFNEKVDFLLDMMDEKDYVKKPEFSAEGECTEKNVSSYCVSMGALELYMAYVETILIVRAKLPKVDEDSNQSSLFSDVSLRNAKIELEIEDAKMVMEQTIKLYDEFKMAYPTHMEYKKIIKSLNKFKIAIKNVREEVETFPGKFIDATSPTCK